MSPSPLWEYGGVSRTVQGAIGGGGADQQRPNPAQHWPDKCQEKMDGRPEAELTTCSSIAPGLESRNVTPCTWGSMCQAMVRDRLCYQAGGWRWPSGLSRTRQKIQSWHLKAITLLWSFRQRTAKEESGKEEKLCYNARTFIISVSVEMVIVTQWQWRANCHCQTLLVRTFISHAVTFIVLFKGTRAQQAFKSKNKKLKWSLWE